MPCPKRMAAALRETFSEDGVKMYTWRAVRRQHLYKLRKQTRTIVFLMALIEILRVGAVDIVYAGKHGTKARGPEDYGIAFNVGYFISWLYMCLFAIIFVIFFSWWIPDLSSDENDPDASPSKTDRVINFLQTINGILLPTCVGIYLAQHIYYVMSTFIYVDARPVDPTVKSQRSLNTRRHWLIRILLLGSVITSLAIGKGAFIIFEELDLARVKTLEYFVIAVPIQVNLGILLGSAIQFKAEQRRNKKLAAQKALDAEAATIGEKQGLLLQA